MYYVLTNIKGAENLLEYSLQNDEIFLIISTVFGAISTILVGRYSCTSKWRGYKVMKILSPSFWAVNLRLSVSTKPLVPSLDSMFFAWVCLSLSFSSVFHALLAKFLIDSGYNYQFKTWKSCSPQVLIMPTHQDIFPFSRMVTKRMHNNIKNSCKSSIV
jgi:hypothetical protein